jgi:hypothetical protein
MQQLTLRSSRHPPGYRGLRLNSNVRFQSPMLPALRILSRSVLLHSGHRPSATPGPVLSVGSLPANVFASESPSFLSGHPSFSSWHLRCEHTHNIWRRAQSIRRGSHQGQCRLPVLRLSAHGSVSVTAAKMRTRACLPSCQSRTLAAMQFVSSSRLGSASRLVTLAHLRSQREPNHSVKRTAPGVPGSAAYLKR